MAEISLVNGGVALIDDADIHLVSGYRWRNLQGYAFAMIDRKLVSMHSLLLDVDQGLLRDHKNGNTLDNRRLNLRAATKAQNARNSKLRVDNTSGFKGVYWNKQYQKWKAQIRIGSKRIFLGRFDDPSIAAKAYDNAAIRYFGEFARLNFPAVF